MRPTAALSLLLGLSLPTTAAAQLNDKWASFEPAPGALPTGATISDDDHETDLDWADLDLDGDTDLVIVRKEPFTTVGRRTNVLLINEAGVLVDRTASHAFSADVPGDLGFLTPTNDRDVVLADLTGDGYPEVVTATEQTIGLPKHVHHPRVYLNLGDGVGGWQGLRFEDTRFPQLFHLGNGTPQVPRFAAVDAGDVDKDGDLDLYFGDHDTGLNLFGQTQPGFEDLDDRLMLNDGNGFFTDGTLASLQLPMVQSGFCNSVELADVNGDGAVDILKQASYQPTPAIISIAYNDPASPGQFSDLFQQPLDSPYFINTGDLNADGRLDIAVTQNDDDKFIVNRGNLPSGFVDWAAPKAVEFIVGAEPIGPFGLTYSSNNLITDVDGDGWGDLLIADVDVEISQYAPDFRLHLYHNQGGVPGTEDVTLLEERASASDATWVGAHGLLPDDLRWTHDVAVFDLDGDADQDLVLSRREGTQVWLQVDPPTCQADLGFGSSDLVLEVCGGDLSTGQDATVSLFAAAPGAATFVAVAAAPNPTPLPDLGVTVAPFPPLAVLDLTTDATGALAVPLIGGGGPASLVLQAFQLSPTVLPLDASNAIEVFFQP